MENNASARVIYTVKEVSVLLHSNIGYVYQLIETGILPALKLGSLKVRKEALDEFLRKYEGYDLSDLNHIKTLRPAS